MRSDVEAHDQQHAHKEAEIIKQRNTHTHTHTHTHGERERQRQTERERGRETHTRTHTTYKLTPTHSFFPPPLSMRSDVEAHDQQHAHKEAEIIKQDPLLWTIPPAAGVRRHTRVS